MALLRDALLLRVRLWRAWPRLARAYREAAPELAAAPAWRARYGAAGAEQTATVSAVPPADPPVVTR